MQSKIIESQSPIESEPLNKANDGENEISHRYRREVGSPGLDISPPTPALQPGSLVEITSGILSGNYAHVIRLMDTNRLDHRALASARQVMLHLIEPSGQTFATIGCDKVRLASEGLTIQTTNPDFRTEKTEEVRAERNRK